MQTVALVYDFDGTLAQGTLQDQTLLPALGQAPSAFWHRVKETTKKENADEILVYMHEIIKEAKNRKIKVSADLLFDHGKSAKLFPGLNDGSWFERINSYSKDNKFLSKHYIISSGIYEMISGCSIFKYFEKIYASKYGYDSSGQVAWPMAAINYTTKTQFLFRINKGIDNMWDNEAINKFIPEHQRPVPFSRMIYIGDGDTDIPCLKMVNHQGGYAIAVYDPALADRDLAKISALLTQDRANFVAPADYRENSHLDIIIRGIIGRMRLKV